MFKSLVLAEWRQFRLVEVSFNRHMTVLTGANASGKTTILNLLSRHFGWHHQFVELPGLPRAARELLLELEDELREQQQQPAPMMTGWTQRPIGVLTYDAGQRALIVSQEAPAEALGSTSGNVYMPNQQQVDGLSIPSHRWVGGYQAVQAIPAQFNPTEALLNSFINEARNRFFGHSPTPQRSPMYWLKEALIAAAFHGPGNEYVRPDPVARSIWLDFQDVLRTLFPSSLGFIELYVRPPDVVVSTKGGDFPLDGLSGGLTALVEIGWQVFLRSRNLSDFCVCIDEPENHLHPALQRIILPKLLETFPGLQFICATHSPFIIGSVSDADVYVLRYGDDNRVSAELLDVANRAATANEVLRDVLGLSTTIPLWAEQRLAEIIEKYSSIDVSEQSLHSLRRQLVELGLSDAIPDTIATVVEGDDAGGDPTS